MSAAPEWLAEAQRQQALIAQLLAPRAPADAPAGLRVYRANAHAAAARALGAACPTIAALLGEEDFAALAREFWHAHPPVVGDLGEWGDELPRWIAAHPGLSEWPYLADCARLDLALHRCERAADARLDFESLALLESEDPARLLLALMPGVAALESPWPIASIHAAHARDAAPSAFDSARERVARRDGEAVIVAREGWRGVVRQVSLPECRFVAALGQERSLAASFDAAGDDFAFGDWLAEALRRGWLRSVVGAVD